MAVKAVHLEPVTQLSTEAFLAAFERFISRRGFCRNVYSDCGTNFVGAGRYLHALSQLWYNPQFQSSLTEKCSRLGVDR